MNRERVEKLIIITAPSGSGKTSIAEYLLKTFAKIKFSVSATTRSPREGEKNGDDYFYITREEFDKKIKEDEFLEWEEFYGKDRYGTLRSQVDKLMESGYFPLLDIEVNGALNVKKMYGSDCVSVFIQPPSLKELEKRLINRGTENSGSIKVRLKRAKRELEYTDHFDYVVINDHLGKACSEVAAIIKSFINT